MPVRSVAVATLLALPVAAQETAEPRVETRDAAEGLELVLNEINTEGYPDVALFATVLRDGAPVAGLGPDDFRVSEDEVEQEPLTVEAQLPPLSVVVTVDVSGSMSKRMEATRAAAASFVTELAPEDAVQVVSFQREISTLTPMATTKDAAIGAIEGLVARGDTALYDGLLTSVDLVADRAGRKAIVLLSDGVDDDGTGQPLSTATVGQALARASEVNVPVFVIGLGTEMDEATLRSIADATGGQYLPAPDPAQLSAVYDSIGDQLSGQYAIRYTSSLLADGTARRVDLETLGLRASKSYTAPGEAPTPAAPVSNASTGCAAKGAIAAEVPELEKTAERYEQDLISSANRRAAHDAALERIKATFAAEPPQTLDCIEAALVAARDLRDRELFNSVRHGELRAILTEDLRSACSTGGRDLQVLEECITLFERAQSTLLINSVIQNDLLQSTAAPFVEALRALDDTDAALQRISELSEMGAFNSVMRRQLESEVLAAE
ncbi:vWA domain-containing protein [Jannaschia marina]|uniref:vWA domain-containing protein n=1 Tax=Jannaschia marina TaxID=2741674 RepID=UPI0015CCB6E7|nr:VWA domain-containing protein [Jannaschia marina]